MSETGENIQVDVFDKNPDGYHHFQSFFLENFEDIAQMYGRFFESLALDETQKIMEVGIGTGLSIAV